MKQYTQYMQAFIFLLHNLYRSLYLSLSALYVNREESTREKNTFLLAVVYVVYRSSQIKTNTFTYNLITVIFYLFIYRGYVFV